MPVAPAAPPVPGPLRTVPDLLAAVDRLPEPARAVARARVAAAVEGDARSCRVALGLLALDLAGGRAATARVPAAASA